MQYLNIQNITQAFHENKKIEKGLRKSTREKQHVKVEQRQYKWKFNTHKCNIQILKYARQSFNERKQIEKGQGKKISQSCIKTA